MKPKPAALVTVEAPVEIMRGDPRFDRARQILAEVKTCYLSLNEYKEALGRELLEIKTGLKFDIVGRKKGTQDAKDSKLPQRAGVSTPRTWPEWTRVELGISDDTADRAIAYFQAFQMLREAIGNDSPVFQAGRVPFESLQRSEIKTITDAVKQLPEGKHKKLLLHSFEIKMSPYILTGGDTTAFTKAFNDPTPALAADFLKATYGALFKATVMIRRHLANPKIEQWLAVVPKVADDPAKGIGWRDYADLLSRLIPECLADLEAIGDRGARFAKARHEGENHPPKRSRGKQPTGKR